MGVLKEPAAPPVQRAVIVDTREQTPLVFRGAPVIRRKLAAGDYSLAGLEGRIAIERKSHQDAWGTASDPTRRERFKRELKLLGTYDAGLILIVCRADYLRTRPSARTKVDGRSIFGSYVAWSEKYGLPVVCVPKSHAAEFAHRWLHTVTQWLDHPQREALGDVFAVTQAVLRTTAAPGAGLLGRGR